MDDVSPQAAGTWFTVLITAGTAAIAGVAKHYVTERFKRKDRELDRMAERDKECAAEGQAFADDMRRMQLELELAKTKAELAETKADLDGMSHDVRALADAKNRAEHERDDAQRRVEAAEVEAARLRMMSSGRTRAPAKEEYAQVPTGEPGRSEHPGRCDRDTGRGAQPVAGTPAVPPVRGRGGPAR